MIEKKEEVLKQDWHYQVSFAVLLHIFTGHPLNKKILALQTHFCFVVAISLPVILSMSLTCFSPLKKLGP